MQTELLNITNIACASELASALNGIPRVRNVKVSFIKGEAMVQYNKQQASPEQLKTIMKDSGYGVHDVSPSLNQQDQDCCFGRSFITHATMDYTVQFLSDRPSERLHRKKINTTFIGAK